MTAIQLWGINTGDNPMYAKYSVTFWGTAACTAVIALLVYLAYKLRNVKLEKSDFKRRKFMGVYSFLYMFAFLLATHYFVQVNVVITLIGQFALTILLIVFAYKYIYKSKRQPYDLLPLLNGTIFIYIVFAVLQGAGLMDNMDPTGGMGVVGIAFAVLVTVVNVVGRRRKKAATTADL